MAAIGSFSSIVTPSSSSNSFSPLPTDHTPTFTHFSPKPTKHILKTLILKPRNFARFPLPLVFPLHLCHCASSSTLDDIVSAISGAEEQNPNDVQSEEVLEELEDVGGTNAKASDSSDEGRLYVGNLPYTMTSSQLSEIFSRAGQIKSVEIIYDKATEKSRGFGFVTMETSDEAKEATRMFDGSQVEGRSIRVNIPEVPREGVRKMMAAKARITNQSFVDTPHKVYAGNLAWAVTTQSLKDAFADQAGFVSAKVIFERERGRSRGFGFVSFKSADDAQSAISAMDGAELEGRAIRLNISADRSRSNAETATEQSEVQSAVNS